jgi:hypothetical protein
VAGELPGIAKAPSPRTPYYLSAHPIAGELQDRETGRQSGYWRLWPFVVDLIGPQDPIRSPAQLAEHASEGLGLASVERIQELLPRRHGHAGQGCCELVWDAKPPTMWKPWMPRHSQRLAPC